MSTATVTTLEPTRRKRGAIMAEKELHEAIGALKAQGEERSKQVDKLFEETAKISAAMVTKDDFKELFEKLTDEHGKIRDKVASLEGDRQFVRSAAKLAIGLPTFLTGIIEASRWYLGKH